MCYDEHKSYQGSFQQGKEQTPWKKKDGITKDVSCILERANEQTENTYSIEFRLHQLLEDVFKALFEKGIDIRHTVQV